MSNEIKKKLYGINDDHDTCSACGKTNLKRVMWIGLDDDSVDPEPFGTTCGAIELAVDSKGGSKKVWSNIANEAVNEIRNGFSNWLDSECFVREIRDHRAINGFRKLFVPKTMIFAEWKQVMNREISENDFHAAKIEQFPIFKVSRFDVGTAVAKATGRGDWTMINDMLEIVRNAPRGLKPVK